MPKISKLHIPSLSHGLTGYLSLVLLLLISGLMLTPGDAVGQVSPGLYNYPHNHLDWYTIESEHYMIHFQTGNSRTAKVVSRAAEEVYPHLTELYDHEPDGKISIVLRDREDYANGAAYFFDNKIDIWVPPLQTHLRGTHDWIRNVISHELTHIIQLQAAMKRKRSVPAIYFQWLSYEDVRRPDVLYGYPKGIISHPFASISIPAWFAEGTAQYQREYLHFDTWDSHRDMILRTSLLDSTALGYTEMAHFSSKTSLEREMVYNHGFAFTNWLADRYGEEVLAKLSTQSAETGEHNFNKVIEAVIGKSGQQIYDTFTREQTEFYEKAVASIDPTSSNPVESHGFYNFYPIFRPGSDTVAYLSNRGRDNSRVSLYLKSLSDTAGSSTSKVADIIQLDRTSAAQHRTLRHGSTGKPRIQFISTAFSFAPDGDSLVFTTARANKYGEEYRDLYIYTLKNGKKRKITQDQRVQDPAWSPSGDQIAAIRLRDGTQNLALYDFETDSMRALTDFDGGQQVTRPNWSPDGRSIYFSYSDTSRRSIKKYNFRSDEVSTVLQRSGVDYRDAFVGPDGKFLYYTANPDGIFNIYRKRIGSRKERQLTSEIGGAFMPAVDPQGRLIYASFTSDGYKIVRSDLDTLLAREESSYGRYQRPRFKDDRKATVVKEDRTGLEQQLEVYNDYRIDSFQGKPYAVADTGRYGFSIDTRGGDDQRSFYAYEDQFTDFTFYPVIRFDNYSKLNGSNGKLLTGGDLGSLGENLYRDFKAGFYFGSREITERLSIFGGALFGLGSQKAEGLNDFFSPGRLVDLDRDLFFMVEYEGLPFIERSWSPTISVELYNLQRNVRDGISIVEFPCTSCATPDTTYTDVAYSIWEADVFLRSKLGRYSMLELGIKYAPYRVTTEGFYSREIEQNIPGTTSQYYKSTTLSLAYNFEWMQYHRHSDIAPIGLKGFAQYSYEPAKLLEDYEVEEGTLSPIYDDIKNHTFELKTRYGFPLWGESTGQIYSRFFTYMNSPDDHFYLDYIGGYTGMRSYPYFALGGNTTAFAQLSYHFPIITEINQQFGRYTFDKVFTRLYAEAGNGWRGPLGIGSNIKTGVGAEMRFAFNSHYLFPLKLFISSSYGFNDFSVKLPEQFITSSGQKRVQYGHDLIFHFGLTFDFEVLW